MVLTRVVNQSELQDDQTLVEQKEKKCYFCGGNHLCRECPQEAILSPILKKYIGSIMENFMGNNFDCPCCKNILINSVLRSAEATPRTSLILG